jgi:hypothetical protein
VPANPNPKENTMPNLKQAAALILSTLAIGAASADYGQPAPEGSHARVLKLKPGSKYLNVTDGETVKFDVDGKCFTWTVGTFSHQGLFKLSDIAPAGVRAEGVTVYVAPNPIYYGS